LTRGARATYFQGLIALLLLFVDIFTLQVAARGRVVTGVLMHLSSLKVSALSDVPLMLLFTLCGLAFKS
jgi:hypothetical protein